MKILRNEHGQAQILTAFGFGAVMLSGAVFMLRFAEKTTERMILTSQRTEMRAALETAIRHASYIYHTQASCDPFMLNLKLSRINPDGTFGSAFTRRQFNFPVSNRTYTVSYGPVTPLPDSPLPATSAGPSQDASVTVWTTFRNQRVSQQAVLINTCTNPCSAACTSAGSCDDAARLPDPGPAYVYPCGSAAPPQIAYHRIVDPSTFPIAPGVTAGSGFAAQCFGMRFLGDLNFPPGSAAGYKDGFIDLRDLVVLKNYLRSGELSGTLRNIMVNDVGGRGCADLNRDSLVNETDQNILEKALRGYLYWIPTRCINMPDCS